MVSDPAAERRPPHLLTLGRVDVVRIQVGYRAEPVGPVYQHYLLDLPAPEAGHRDAFDEPRVLAALEPVLYGVDGAPRHYSLHEHRWHTSWGPSLSAWEIGLLVTAGTKSAACSDAWKDGVVRAFGVLLHAAERANPTSTSRDAAVLRARRSAAAAYAVDPDSLSLRAEEHHPATNSWTVGLRALSGDAYEVVVGLVDGYPGAVWVRHRKRTEVSDSVGAE